MVIFLLAPDQTIAQMWSNGVWGGCGEAESQAGAVQGPLASVPHLPHTLSQRCSGMWYRHWFHAVFVEHGILLVDQVAVILCCVSLC